MIVMDPSQFRGLAPGWCGWWSPRRGRVGHEDGISGGRVGAVGLLFQGVDTICSFSFTCGEKKRQMGGGQEWGRLGKLPQGCPGSPSSRFLRQVV